MKQVAENPKAAATAPRKRRRLWRWLWRGGLAAVILLALLRLALPVLLPSILGAVLGGIGLQASYDRLDLSLVGGGLQLWGLEVRPASAESDGENPLLAVNYAELDIDMSALLSGTVRLHRVEIDSLQAVVSRDAGGELNWARIIGGAAAETAPEPEPAAEPAAEPGPWDFSLPVEISALRVQDVRITVHDAAQTPAFDREVRFELSLSDLGAADRDARLHARLRCPPVLDSLEVSATGQAHQEGAHADLQVTVGQLQPGAIAHYLEALGIRLHAEQLGLRAAASLRAGVAGDATDTIEAAVEIRQLALRADGTEVLALDHGSVAASAWSSTQLTISKVEIEDGHGGAELCGDGTLRIAKVLEIAAGAATEETATAAAPPGGKGPDQQPDKQPIVADSAPEFRWQVQQIAAKAVTLHWRDATVEPVVDTAVAVDQLDVGSLGGGGGAPAGTPMSARVRATGIVDPLAIDGQLQLGSRLAVDVTVSAAHFAPQAVEGYLRGARLGSTLRDGKLEGQVRGGLSVDEAGRARADLTLEKVKLSDTDSLLDLQKFEIAGFWSDSDSGAVHVDKITADSIELPIERTASGGLRFLGFQTLPSTDPAGLATQTTAKVASALPLRLEIGGIDVHGVGVRFTDSLLGLEPFDAHLDCTTGSLAIGGAVAGATAPIHLAGAIDGTIESITVDGTITAHPGPLALDAQLQLRGKGVSTTFLQPYLRPFGWQPELASASVSVDVAGGLRQADSGAIAAHAAVTELAVREGDTDLLALETLRVRGATVGPDGTRIESVEIDGPVLSASRSADGVLHLAGMALNAPPPPAKPDAVTPAPPATDPAADPLVPAAAPTGPELAFALAHLQWQGARLNWHDEAVSPPLQTALTMAADVTNLATDDDTPAKFSVSLAVDEVLGDLTVAGTLETTPDSASLHAEVQGERFRGKLLDSYLPPHQRVAFRQGRLHVAVDARIAPSSEGGQEVVCDIKDLLLADGDRPAWLAMDALRFHVGRYDPEHNTYVIEEASIAGMQVRVRRTGPTTVEAFGLAMTPPAPQQPPAAPAAVPTPRVWDLRRFAATLPLVRLDKLDLELALLEITDETQPDGAAPLSARLRLTTPGSQLLLDPDPTELPPIKFQIGGAVEPLIGKIELGLEVTPYEDRPGAVMQLAVHDIRGSGLTEWRPELAERLDGSKLEGGSLTAQMTAAFDVARSGPVLIDWSRTIGLEVSTVGPQFRASPDGEITAGVESIYLYAPRFLGADGNMRIRSLEIDNPTGRVYTDKDGTQVLGMLLQPQAQPERAPDPAATDAGAARGAAVVDASSTAPDAPKEPARDVRIDEFLITGLDFEYHNVASDPPMLLPLKGMDVEVTRFSTRAWREHWPIDFRASVQAGPVPLPKREASGFRPLHLVTSTVSAVTGSEKTETELRPLFDEVAVEGSLALAPQLDGWTNINASGVELLAFRGPAKGGGVTIQDGVLDGGVGMKFTRGGVDVKSRLKFSSLALDEPAGGPISTFLKLPAPLNTVIFALRDDRGELTLQPDFVIPPGGVTTAEVTRLALTALANQIATAVARSPLRVTGFLTGIVTRLFSSDPTDKLRDHVVQLPFPSGTTELTPALLEQLAPLVALLEDDDGLSVILRHTIGSDDIDRARLLATPTPEQSRAVANRFRLRKAELQQQRNLLAASTRADIMTGQPADLTKLQRLTAELGRVERALDAVLDQLRAGSDRRAERRTRALALRLGQTRLERVQRYLIERGLDGRVEIRRPRIGLEQASHTSVVTAEPRARVVRN